MTKSHDLYIIVVRCCAALCLFVGVVCVSANVVRVAQTGAKKVAVLEFRNLADLTDSEVTRLADSVRDIAARTLSKESFVVMTREDITNLTPANTTRVSWALSESMVGIGRLLGADYLISGEVLKYDDGYRARLRVHQCRTSLFLGSSTARGETISLLQEEIENAAASVFKLIRTREPLANRTQNRSHERGREQTPPKDTPTGGDSLPAVKKPAGGSAGTTLVLVPTRRFIPGSRDSFHMHGDAGIWCWDPSVGDTDSADSPPIVVATDHSQHRHVARGGGFLGWEMDCLSASPRRVIRGRLFGDVGMGVAKPAD
ncbi:MAG: hypothetical protein JSW58_04640 [Candidatus Latescibacterota bacterium]|nr:MAG: hypothetical protein JSW58_04640 [Candidatus Latescibacterota bacterium]